jgi:hypothetical protein
MEGEFWHIRDEQQRDNFISHVRSMQLPFKAQTKADGSRSLSQNSAMHLYFRLLAIALNAAGYDQRKTLKPEAEIPWNDESVKQNLWAPIMRAVTGKDSTSALEKSEVSEVYEVLNRHLASKTGVSVEFPSET